MREQKHHHHDYHNHTSSDHQFNHPTDDHHHGDIHHHHGDDGSTLYHQHDATLFDHNHWTRHDDTWLYNDGASYTYGRASHTHSRSTELGDSQPPTAAATSRASSERQHSRRE